jgi:hypothetical protein
MTHIGIIERTLSDGSKVYAVAIHNGDESMVFEAVTVEDAYGMAQKFQDILEAHTNEEVSPVW